MSPIGPEDIGALVAGSSVLALLVLGVLGLLVPVIAYWKILEKTGHPGPLALLYIFPFVGIIMLYWLALAEWPALRPRTAAPAPVAFPPPPQAIQAAPADEPPAPAAPAFKFCAGCGIGLEGSERFCRNCGRPVGT